MNWFTIYVENPRPILEGQCNKNGAGQFILFDGKGSVERVTSEARMASYQCDEVQVFRGKRLGKLMTTFRNGAVECTYCGKAHL